MNSNSNDQIWLPSTTAFQYSDLSCQWLVLHFWASWNKIDIKMDSNLKKIIPLFIPKVEFRSVDIDSPDSLNIYKKAEIGNIPSLAFFNAGKHSKTLIGLSMPTEIAFEIQSWIITTKKS